MVKAERCRPSTDADTASSSIARALGRTGGVLALVGWFTASIVFGAPAFAQDDDWSVVSDQVHESHSAATASKHAAPQTSHGTSASAVQSTDDGPRMICGEMARPATEPYTSIVAELNRQAGTNAPVYESMQPGSPHVSRGGCIFYNTVFLDAFLRGETDSHGVPDRTSMLYAIMAHELGHIVHRDYDREVSSVTKELEADRFSGYMLSRLGVARDNITAYYSLGGDEFSGVHDHGFSSQRTAAFDQGWKRAEWNQPEDGGAKAENAGATSEDVGGTDDSSAAAAVP